MDVVRAIKAVKAHCAALTYQNWVEGKTETVESAAIPTLFSIILLRGTANL